MKSILKKTKATKKITVVHIYVKEQAPFVFVIHQKSMGLPAQLQPFSVIQQELCCPALRQSWLLSPSFEHCLPKQTMKLCQYQTHLGFYFIFSTK